MDYLLPETNLVQIKTMEKVGSKGIFVIEPLSPGYGITLGNSLRRILLSSLEGAAITSITIEGVAHEFSSIPAVTEDVVEIILNLKTLRFKLNSDEPIKLKMKIKGPKDVKASDFEPNPQCEVINKETHIATVGKTGKLNLGIIIQRGRGYVPVEARGNEKLPIGAIAIDSIFTPVKKIHYDVENTRVGERTDYNKLIMEISTDGSIEPEKALYQAAQILIEHFSLFQQAFEEQKNEESKKQIEPLKKKTTKTVKKAKTAKKTVSKSKK